MKKETELYLKQLCGTTGYPWSKVPLTVFEPLEDRRDINKAFFALDAAPPVGSINPSQRAALKDLSMAKHSTERLEGELGTVISAYQTHIQRANTQSRKMVELRRLIKRMETGPQESLESQVEAIHAAGKWKLSRVSTPDNLIEFEQVNDTVIRWKDTDQETDMTVVMGRYKVKLILDGTVSIGEAGNNIRSNGDTSCIHPHIFTDGSICWGNAQEHLNQALEDCNLMAVLDVVHTYLHEYNDDSPTAGLHAFEDARRERDNYVPPEYIGPMWVHGDWFDGNRASVRISAYCDDTLSGSFELEPDTWERVYLVPMWYAKDTGRHYMGSSPDKLHLMHIRAINKEFHEECCNEYVRINGTEPRMIREYKHKIIMDETPLVIEPQTPSELEF